MLCGLRSGSILIRAGKLLEQDDRLSQCDPGKAVIGQPGNDATMD